VPPITKEQTDLRHDIHTANLSIKLDAFRTRMDTRLLSALHGLFALDLVMGSLQSCLNLALREYGEVVVNRRNILTKVSLFVLKATCGGLRTYYKPFRLYCCHCPYIVLSRKDKFIIDNPFEVSTQHSTGMQQYSLIILNGSIGLA